jgi:lysophospholipase L1-like esterase
MIQRLIVTALLSASFIHAATEEPQLRWISLPSPQLEVNGLPWYSENSGELFRLPVKLMDTFRREVWDLAKSPSGARIRFRTDSPVVAIRVEYPSPPNMKNMHAFGQTGIDLYADGVYYSTATADKDAKPGKVYEHIYFDVRDSARAEREIVLYLPLYKPAKVISIGIDKEAKLDRARSFAAAKPVVFYGTSITQGGCASRSGMSYQAILGRKLNLDFVNLGFSGNGKGEPEVAKVVAGIDASAFVLDFAQNNQTVESLREVYQPFVEAVRARHPDTPIIAITPIYAAGEAWNAKSAATKDGMRELIRKVVAQRIAGGDRNIQIIEGTDLIGPSRVDGLVDGTHPNDLGFQWMAEGISGRLRQVLRVP